MRTGLDPISAEMSIVLDRCLMEELGNLHPHGIFLRREALAAGYDDRVLYRALANGSIARVRHGAYVDSRVWSGLDEQGRHVLRAHATTLGHEPPFAVSHISGALLHGVRAWGGDLTRIHLSRPLPAVGRKHRDISYHRETVADAVQIDGTPTLPVADCVLGACRLSSVEAGMVLVDSAYDLQLCSPTELADRFDATRGWPGTARLQITLRLAQPGAQSVGESRMRFLLWSVGLPKPELQYVVEQNDVVVGVADFAWPQHRLFGEFDGRVKYEALLRPGESASDVVIREKRREDRMREITGWSFIRFTWADLHDPDRTVARLRKAMGLARR